MVGAAVIGEAVVGAEVVLLLSAAVVDAANKALDSGELFNSEISLFINSGITCSFPISFP